MTLLGVTVDKREGTRFVGIVVAEFNTINGDKRVVVEAIADEYRGLLHIYRPDQLVPYQAPDR